MTTASAIVGSTEDATYTAAMLRTPAKPFKPWRTTSLVGQSVVVDFGAPVALDVVALIGANFTFAVVQGNAADSWGSSSYVQNTLIARNPVTGRYHHLHDTALSATPFVFQFLRLSIPDQTPTDGAGYYRLGGIWAGLWDAVPRDIDLPYTPTCEEPGYLIEPDHKGSWEQWLNMGEPRAVIQVTRYARAGDPTPGRDDELFAWRDLERLMRERDAFLIQTEAADPAQGWVVRRAASPAWTVDLGRATSPMLLRELTGG